MAVASSEVREYKPSFIKSPLPISSPFSNATSTFTIATATIDAPLEIYAAHEIMKMARERQATYYKGGTLKSIRREVIALNPHSDLFYSFRYEDCVFNEDPRFPYSQHLEVP